MPRREIDVFGVGLIRDEEPKPVAVPSHHAGDERNPVDQAKPFAAVPDDLPVAHHCLQPGTKALALVAIELEGLGEFVEADRNALLLEVAQEMGPARHGMGVLAGLRCRLRIAAFPLAFPGHDGEGRAIRARRAFRRAYPFPQGWAAAKAKQRRFQWQTKSCTRTAAKSP